MADTTNTRRRRGVAGLCAGGLGLGLTALLFAGAPTAPAPRSPLPSRTPRPPGVALSLFALGDTGENHFWPSLREGQLAVARELVEEDLARPVDALLLLGDNFYPDGLLRHELVERVGRNLVWPYCRFLALDGPRSAEVRGACTLPPELRRPVPVHAVLGNHDHESAESAALQRDVVPALLPGWRVGRGLADVVDLAPGLSLILVDSPSVRTSEDVAQVVRELRRAAGPWRILALHEPLLPASEPVPWPSAALLRRALTDADVPVQLVLAGHTHNLQVHAPRSGVGALHVLAGAGATRRAVEYHFEGVRFAEASTGFARVDWIPGGPASELRVTLFRTPRYPAAWWQRRSVAAAFAVGRDGAVRELDEAERP